MYYSASRFFDRDYFHLFRVHVHYTGRVRWWIGGIMETSCSLDGTLFPFDSQSCKITIQSWAYSDQYAAIPMKYTWITSLKMVHAHLWNVLQAER